MTAITLKKPELGATASTVLPSCLGWQVATVLFDILLHQKPEASTHRLGDNSAVNVDAAALLPSLKQFAINPKVDVLHSVFSDTWHSNRKLGRGTAQQVKQ